MQCCTVFGRPFVKRCALCYLTVVCPVCDVGVLWPNGWTGPDETWHAGRPRPWPHCVRWGPSFPPQKGGGAPRFSAHVYCGHGRPSRLLLSSCITADFVSNLTSKEAVREVDVCCVTWPTNGDGSMSDLSPFAHIQAASKPYIRLHAVWCIYVAGFTWSRLVRSLSAILTYFIQFTGRCRVELSQEDRC